MQTISSSSCLPADLNDALLIGRLWRPAPIDGPSVIAVRGGQVFDITAAVATTADLLERPDVLDIARNAPGEALGPVDAFVTASLEGAAADELRLLAPCDLQPIKACGVTFAVSLIERLIEEQAGGSVGKAQELRQTIHQHVGADFSKVRPGSEAALKLKAELERRGAWSQYMEVGIGPDAEVFSKSQAMSSVGLGAEIGLHPVSKWNNPEPEVVLAVNSRGEPVGATLGNDVNLRDVEGRSALLLGKAKDNNGSCSIGPFIRLFDERFTLDSVRSASISLKIEGADDGFVLEGISHMSEINRDPIDLVEQTYGAHHQYPDGFMLFLGTMFSPIKDRDEKDSGFTHHLGDVVTISTPALGSLVNTVQFSTEIAPWTFGVRALYRSLGKRGLLA
jgi:fumarylacetoacetate (FAA) hydrolase family protein